MEILKQPMGDYQTNCYIVKINNKELIIDPGVGATLWVKQNVSNPLAILNTHGHFDHVWSNAQLSKELDLKIYCPKDDNFMLEKDPYSFGMTPSYADILVEPDQEFDFDGIKVKFHHFPGHTPGCSAIQIEDALFSGDFIFQNSIGRCDFPFSNPSDMKKSINKILKWEKNIRIYPGHGSNTSLFQEKDSLKNWLNYL
ncbi:MBL fold metallo-hydrolase [Malaciobacter mytili]|uniref:MBL fold metallo-hydrolase n=1 Tax=Malaciobacter mytili LMG 24559 TaxID=1032238 RepID=A0AAX2ACP7_9BACT|nr:MBL fold metallo-hydrolase [Malaciobacter mytili]AXH14962.1 metallo-beta-lactamase family protein [Malaciobacter mytili LMG 24559]RXK12964.1 MBL fold metallo-hydrolase [Malaciobacter mytili LMG 24559]